MPHQLIAFFCVETTLLSVFFCNPAVHLCRSGEPFKIFAASLHVERSESHTVKVDQFYADFSILVPVKKNISSAIIQMCNAIIVKNGCYMSYFTQNRFFIFKRLYFRTKGSYAM